MQRSLFFLFKNFKNHFKDWNTLLIWNDLSLSFYSLVILIVLFLSDTQYAAKQELSKYNHIFLIFCLLIGTGVLLIIVRIAKYNSKLHFFRLAKKTTARIFFINISIWTSILLILQEYNITSAWFITDWDAGQAVNAIFSPSNYEWLYSYYPNNLFLIGIFRILHILFNTTTYDSAYLLILQVGAVFISVSCLLTTFAAYYISSGNCKIGYATFILLSIFIVLSPQAMIPYTDSYGMLAPAICLFIYSRPLAYRFKVPLVCFFSVLGSFLKPNAAIVLIAISIIEFSRLLPNLISCGIFDIVNSLKKRAGSIFVTFLFLFLAALSGKAVQSFGARDMTIHPGWSVSPAHYLMMGWNQTSGGSYNQDDVNFTLSYSNSEDRTKANLRVFTSRISEMGLPGILDLGSKKILSTFADGSGSWRMEGTFFVEQKGNNSRVCSFYGIGNYSVCGYTFIAQFTWMFILCGIVLQWFNPNISIQTVAVNLTLLGQGLFLILFECRARYLIQFWPFFIFASVLGWSSFIKKIQQRIE